MSWESDLNTRIAGEIRRLRTDQGMSAQNLADRVKERGLPVVTRSTIADIETGRRKYVTVAELMALAAALGTAPLALVYPGPYTDAVDVIPKVPAPQLRALQWFTGERLNSPHLTELHRAQERDRLADQQKAMLGMLGELTDPGMRAAAAAVVGELARQSAVLDAEPPARRPDVLADVIALDARSS